MATFLIVKLTKNNDYSLNELVSPPPPFFNLTKKSVQKAVSAPFLQCPMADFLWNTLFGAFGECWVCPASLDQCFLTSFAGVGRRKDAKSLWQCAMYATIWSIWLERNYHIFNDRFSDKQVLWDRVRHFAFIWCKAHDLFRGIYLSDMLRNWKAMLHR